LQSACPALQVSVHVELLHDAMALVALHVIPQPPQLWRSDVISVHVLFEQGSCPGPQAETHMPLLHTPLQLLLLQEVTGVHVPALHVPLQAAPHAPQFAGSVRGSTRELLHNNMHFQLLEPVDIKI
jgi:hypothetical protein